MIQFRSVDPEKPDLCLLDYERVAINHIGRAFQHNIGDGLGARRVKRKNLGIGWRGNCVLCLTVAISERHDGDIK